jgi:hypothetical protein
VQRGQRQEVAARQVAALASEQPDLDLLCILIREDVVSTLSGLYLPCILKGIAVAAEADEGARASLLSAGALKHTKLGLTLKNPGMAASSLEALWSIGMSESARAQAHAQGLHQQVLAVLGEHGGEARVVDQASEPRT